MTTKIPLRMIFSSLAGVTQGFLLAWTLTLDRSTVTQLFALGSIMGLLFIFHLFSSRIFNRSILIITSYLEGLFLFIVTMISFRIGDHLMGITSLSFRTEIFLFSVAAMSAVFYVWSMRIVVKDR